MEHSGASSPKVSNEAQTVYTIGAFAKLTGVTERTLRFYHKKGLLAPSGYNDLGHRLYTERDLIRLQQILTLKFLDYPLDRIAGELEVEGEALKRSLERQRQLLRQKREQLDRMLDALDDTLNLAEVEEGKVWETDILLLMIRSISLEAEQRRRMEERLPEELANLFWMDGIPKSERRKREREMMNQVVHLKKLMQSGRPPEDPEVQKIASGLNRQASKLLEQLGRPLSPEELEELEAFMKAETPLHVPLLFTNEEEHYLERMWAQTENDGMNQGIKGDEMHE
ncbi:MerR family transcriptional regulator [Saccharibacillus kuerlensis]|uniref:HTH merR-type domain-containing protein n=1 Tax=Saccharibacillus kuerlensis TaxID=459527 RepID=A0ABQ2L302_9BACL|nr:MerR family transcriptional regulator [Saccharibacillus kuerlensis]GGO00498.1 hypothetical protein GCM10010969_21800 [Saccharibacillus kuerlensis]